MQNFDYQIPTQILFGRGRIAGLGALIAPAVRRVFVVTDETIAVRTPALGQTLHALGGRPVRTFARVRENPSIASVEEGAREAREFGAELILGLGGGSPLDAAKGIALLSTNEGELRLYLGGEPLAKTPLPLIAIPTTSGTGSEVTPYAVFTDPDAGNKIGYGNPGIFPAAALIDPDLAATMPASVAVNTGLDALTHAVEAFLSTIATPLSDAVALQAIDIVLTHLGRAVRREDEAVDQMACAAMLAGLAITQAGTILPHIMGYPLTVYHGVPHGRASAIMLVHVLADWRSNSVVPDKVRRIDALFTPHSGLEAFLGGFGVSTKLSNYGVGKDEIPLYAQKTIVKGDIRMTPGEVTVDSLERTYRSAL